MSELLPCPFCGEQPAPIGARRPFVVHCDMCGSETPQFNNSELAAKRWNTRAAMPQGEPVAWQAEWEEGGEKVRQFYGDEATALKVKSNVAAYMLRVTTPVKVIPLYASPSLPVSEPGVRERIYNVALAELEKKRLMPTSVTLATAIANAAAAALTSPSNGKAQP